MSWRGLEKRVKSPTSATSTTAIDQRDPAHRLQGVNDRALVPFREKAEYLFFDPPQAPFRIHDGIDVVLKCDLLGGMFEGQGRKPSPVSHSPGRPRLVLAPVTQQKSLKMLARARHHLSHDAAQPDQSRMAS
jgi:hypothetical protein